jgi:hypothetical protein
LVSASADQTLKVWDLEAGACILTHRANVGYTAVAATATTVIAGDATGGIWVLDWPMTDRHGWSRRGSHGHDDRHGSIPDGEPLSTRPPMPKHTILFLAANPSGTDPRALDREARAIQVELERSGFRDHFELVARWAAEPLDLLRELRKLRPTVVHFSGHGALDSVDAAPDPAPRRDVIDDLVHSGDVVRHGLFFQGSDGRPQLVSIEAIAQTFGAAGSSVKLVVPSGCHSDAQARALLAHVDCVVGVDGSISDAATRSFAIGFYGGLGEREPVAVAYEQGCAAISLAGLPDGDRLRLEVRAGVDARQLVLAAGPR